MDRIFVAVPLTEPARAAIAEALPPDVPGRRVPPENWHLTLRFIGGASGPQQETLSRELVTLSATSPFRIVFGRCGAFPRPARATVLWLGVSRGEEALRELAGRTEDCVRRAGLPEESRRFSAHLTLSRLREPADLRPVFDSLPAIPVEMPVDSVLLYRSLLGSGPARYEVIRRFSLRGAAEAEVVDRGTKISGNRADSASPGTGGDDETRR